ncbi:MAG: S41 family peptidase [Verrucomicrobia bacterium]|nr:S41 family peptidase [Verrucomicrobiota bacterium]
MRRGIIVLVFFAGLIPVAAFSPLGEILGEWFSPRHRSETRQFAETLRLVTDHFVQADSLNTQQLTGDAIEHMLRSLDENSEYLPRKEAEEFEIETEQRYGGIGVEVEWVDERVTIVSPFADSPGELVGLLPGDQIIRVNGKSVAGIRYREIIEKLRGPAGSKIAFSVFRPSSKTELDMEVIRQVIKVDSVRGVAMIEPGIGYIRITQFGTKTYGEFEVALESLEQQDLRGLILDLRNNPGGVLSAAVDIAGEFFDKGETVVYTKGKDSSHDKLYPARTPLRDVDYSIVVLVNGGSASASEIVAGALQDIHRARLVGTRTFGKGSVQTIFQYRSGDAMRLTTAMFFTPGGRVIHKNGIQPDVVVPLTDEELRKLMLQRRYLSALGKDGFTDKYGFEPIEDKQLEVALEVVRERSLL